MQDDHGMPVRTPNGVCTKPSPVTESGTVRNWNKVQNSLGWTIDPQGLKQSSAGFAGPDVRSTTLPTDSNKRKEFPIFRGVLRYFPAALAGVARISKTGNDKHNPGQDLHHARGKSTDHGDCIIRHMMDLEDLRASGASPEVILTEASSLAWRALALSQELHEVHGAPLAPGAKR